MLLALKMSSTILIFFGNFGVIVAMFLTSMGNWHFKPNGLSTEQICTKCKGGVGCSAGLSLIFGTFLIVASFKISIGVGQLWKSVWSKFKILFTRFAHPCRWLIYDNVGRLPGKFPTFGPHRTRITSADCAILYYSSFGLVGITLNSVLNYCRYVVIQRFVRYFLIVLFSGVFQCSTSVLLWSVMFVW